MRHFSELGAWRQSGLGGAFVRGKMEFEETLRVMQHAGVVLMRDIPGSAKGSLGVHTGFAVWFSRQFNDPCSKHQAFKEQGVF